MAGMTIERELFDLETQYWQALKDKDVEAAIALTDEPPSSPGRKASR